MCVAEIPREARTLKAYGQQKRLRQQRDLTNGCKSPRSLAAQRQASAAVLSVASSIVEKMACYVKHRLSTEHDLSRARVGLFGASESDELLEISSNTRSSLHRVATTFAPLATACGGPPEAIAAVLSWLLPGVPCIHTSLIL